MNVWIVSVSILLIGINMICDVNVLLCKHDKMLQTILKARQVWCFFANPSVRFSIFNYSSLKFQIRMQLQGCRTALRLSLHCSFMCKCSITNFTKMDRSVPLALSFTDTCAHTPPSLIQWVPPEQLLLVWVQMSWVCSSIAQVCAPLFIPIPFYEQ